MSRILAFLMALLAGLAGAAPLQYTPLTTNVVIGTPIAGQSPVLQAPGVWGWGTGGGGGGGGGGAAEVVYTQFSAGAVTISSTNITSTCGFAVMPLLTSNGNVFVTVTNIVSGGFGNPGQATFVSSFSADNSYVIISIMGPGGTNGGGGGSGTNAFNPNQFNTNFFQQISIKTNAMVTNVTHYANGGTFTMTYKQGGGSTLIWDATNTAGAQMGFLDTNGNMFLNGGLTNANGQFALDAFGNLVVGGNITGNADWITEGKMTANGGYYTPSGQVVSWNSDTGFSRVGQKLIAVGNGTQGDASGTLKTSFVQLQNQTPGLLTGNDANGNVVASNIWKASIRGVINGAAYVYFVNPTTGSDTTYDGLTPATPFLTVTNAMAVAAPGSTLDGMTNWFTNIVVTNASLTFRNFLFTNVNALNAPCALCTNGTQFQNCLFVGSTNAVTNFNNSLTYQAGTGAYWPANSGTNLQNVGCVNCTFSNLTYGAMFNTANGGTISNAFVSNCVAIYLGAGAFQALDSTNSRTAFTNVNFSRNKVSWVFGVSNKVPAYAILVNGANGVVIDNNDVRNIGQSWSYSSTFYSPATGGSDGIILTYCTGFVVSSNFVQTVWDPSQNRDNDGIDVDQVNRNGLVIANCAIGCGGPGIAIEGGWDNITFQNNYTYGNGVGQTNSSFQFEFLNLSRQATNIQILGNRFYGVTAGAMGWFFTNPSPGQVIASNVLAASGASLVYAPSGSGAWSATGTWTSNTYWQSTNSYLTPPFNSNGVQISYAAWVAAVGETSPGNVNPTQVTNSVTPPFRTPDWQRLADTRHYLPIGIPQLTLSNLTLLNAGNVGIYSQSSGSILRDGNASPPETDFTDIDWPGVNFRDSANSYASQMFIDGGTIGVNTATPNRGIGIVMDINGSVNISNALNVAAGITTTSLTLFDSGAVGIYSQSGSSTIRDSSGSPAESDFTYIDFPKLVIRDPANSYAQGLVFDRTALGIGTATPNVAAGLGLDVALPANFSNTVKTCFPSWTNIVGPTGITNIFATVTNIYNTNGTIIANGTNLLGVVTTNGAQLNYEPAYTGPGTGVNGITWFPATNVDIVTTVTMTNFILNQYYTNLTGSVLLLIGSSSNTVTGVAGNSSLSLMVSNSNSGGFSNYMTNTLITGLTTVGATNLYHFNVAVSNGCTYFFTNSSAGGGDAAGIVGGTGQIVTIGNATASGVPSLGGNNTLTGNNFFNNGTLNATNPVFTIAGNNVSNMMYQEFLHKFGTPTIVSNQLGGVGCGVIANKGDEMVQFWVRCSNGVPAVSGLILATMTFANPYTTLAGAIWQQNNSSAGSAGTNGFDAGFRPGVVNASNTLAKVSFVTTGVANSITAATFYTNVLFMNGY